jgi:hypothetical protein
VKISAIPQVEGLTVDDFLNHARKKQEFLHYLPDERDWHHLDKKWMCDILYTLDTSGIQHLIVGAMAKRKDKLEKNQNMIVELRPEFAAALKKCTSFSSKHHI